MDKTWIKLYRKSRDNPLMKDMRSWMIFCWILLSVDRETGKMTIGRKWASNYFEMPESTFYDNIKRLEKRYKVVTLATGPVTGKFTIITVINWHLYQDGNRPGNNRVTIDQQLGNNWVTHIQEVRSNTNVLLKKKEERDSQFQKEFLDNKAFQDSLKERFPLVDIGEEIEKMKDWLAAEGVTKSDYAAFARNWLRKARPETSEEVAIIRA